MREKLRKLFQDEANSVANLRHDNIVSTFDTGLHEGCRILVMDYIEGQTLLRVIQRGERVTRPRGSCGSWRTCAKGCLRPQAASWSTATSSPRT